MEKHRQVTMFLSLITVTMLCVSCFAKPLLKKKNPDHINYAVLLDAGSSSTKMAIYQFLSSGPSLHFSEIVQLSPSPYKAQPGLSDFASDPTQVEAYIMPLIVAATKTVPRDEQASTPIYLLATAGMRLLPEDQANDLLTEVRNLFNDKEKCPFLFENDNNARIITGQAEAIYSWVTVNFLANVFHSGRKPYGSLDLGGASHQNTWPFRKNHSDTVIINIAGKNVSLFARSYLGYGLNEARKRYLKNAAQNAGCKGRSQCVVTSPCHNKGFKEEIQFDDQKPIFKGTANVALCRKVIKEIFFCHLPDLKRCPFYDQPKLNGTFYAFSAFYYVLTGIGSVCSDCDDIQVSPEMINRHSKSFCEKHYDEIKKNPHAKDNCFGANYIYEALTAGYKLSSGKEILVANSLNGFDLGWSLGATLYNTGILKE